MMDNAVARQEGGSDVVQYDPDHGLRSIAVSEAAEKHFRRAKDASKLFEAIETKLTEQAKYVVWRDGIVAPSRQVGGPGRGIKRAAELSPVLPGDDPGKDVVKRWRKRLCGRSLDGQTIVDKRSVDIETQNLLKTIIDTAKLSATLNEAELRCLRVCEQEPKGTERGTAGTGEFLRYTPSAYVEAVREVLGTIDLDPASDAQAQKVVKAETYFTAERDGLKLRWHGNIFLNPPYHRELCPAFVNKLIAELKEPDHVKQAIMLTNNSTDTEWFRKAAMAANAICFTNGRIAFTTPAGGEVAPTQGQAFFYFGSNVKKFVEVFRKIGFGVTPVWQYAG
jgi:phage N-6-adenine-methyltransferase